jgi:hypothetical protein
MEVEVVTADGSIKRANEDENGDLFFVSLSRSVKVNCILY